jgi:hypothetical protein
MPKPPYASMVRFFLAGSNDSFFEDLTVIFSKTCFICPLFGRFVFWAVKVFPITHSSVFFFLFPQIAYG